jgi:hypothetical protein
VRRPEPLAAWRPGFAKFAEGVLSQSEVPAAFGRLDRF